MKNKIIIILTLSITLISCAQDDSNKSDSTSYTSKNSYISKWHHFKMNLPDEWTFKKIPDDNNVLIYNAKDEEDSQEGNERKFMIKVFALPEAYTSKYTCEVNLQSFKDDPTFENLKVLTKSEYKIDKYDAVKLVFTATVQGNETTSIQYYLAIDKKLFIFGGSILSTYLGNTDKIFDKMLGSVQFD